MARKSNKTAHVLNLLSSGQEPEEELEKEEELPAAKPEAEAAGKPNTEVIEEAAPAEAVSSAAPASPPQPEVPPNISIIDSGALEEDPVADRIREELLKNLDPEDAKELETETQTAEPEKEEAPKTPAAETTAASAQETLIPKETEEEEVLELQEEPEAQAEPPKEPEPEYVMVNVMQRIVEDKIIYFMKQFEVCTCHRCKTDTIALTLSGLPAKYMVMDRHAVDPMISYLTSRLISQVTVEALKACTQVKEHPRHQPGDEKIS